MSWNDVRNESTREKIPYTKFPEGLTKIRILDAEPYSWWQHWIPSTMTGVTCPGGDCPICDVIKKQKEAGTSLTFNNSRRHALRIWNYSTNQMEVMIQGRGFMQNILALHEEVGDIRTYDIKIKRSGTDKSTTYTALPTAPSDFEFTDQIYDVDMEETFKAPDRATLIQRMQGKKWSDLKNNEDTTA